MIKTLKTVLAVAITFSIVTISNASANAIKKWSDGEFSFLFYLLKIERKS